MFKKDQSETNQTQEPEQTNIPQEPVLGPDEVLVSENRIVKMKTLRGNAELLATRITGTDKAAMSAYSFASLLNQACMYLAIESINGEKVESPTSSKGLDALAAKFLMTDTTKLMNKFTELNSGNSSTPESTS